MGSLSGPNKIKDVYTKLVFKGTDGLLYVDDGTNDVQVMNPAIQGVLKSATLPGSGTEGDLYYDTDDDKLYTRDEDSWNEIVTSISGTVDGGSY
jgi:hypothetical protein|tara:strand:+ start:263 stop:544 length:282 start_codon:yes stop_codon:yes gene_type:complete